MGKIVRRTPGTPLSAEALDELKKLEAMPDNSIDTSAIPEWTEEQFARALARREERWKAEAAALAKKAS